MEIKNVQDLQICFCLGEKISVTMTWIHWIFTGRRGAVTDYFPLSYCRALILLYLEGGILFPTRQRFGESSQCYSMSLWKLPVYPIPMLMLLQSFSTYSITFDLNCGLQWISSVILGFS